MKTEIIRRYMNSVRVAVIEISLALLFIFTLRFN